MESVVNALNAAIWSPALIYLCLGVGLYFSIRTRFVQVRGVAEMVRLLRGGSSAAGVSSFQALTMSLSGRVRTGNIAGVATAIAYGGPGAVFWMWIVAFLGASTAYIESTLAQIYKEKDASGQYRGGPAYYIEKAMRQKWYATLFAVVTVIATGLLLPGVQANSISAGLLNAWAVPPWMTGVGLALALAAIIFGGVKRIAQFTEVVVPFMALGYIGVAVYIVATHSAELPAVFSLIFRSAFGTDAAFGAILGAAVQWGVKRGVYSNEAGQGTGPHPAAAAEVNHPAEQGYVQAFSVYLDTLLVCTATALMILCTGRYNVVGKGGAPLFSGLAGSETGPAFAQAAVEAAIPGWGAGFVALALLFFAFTTIVAYYYMAETNLSYLTHGRGNRWLLHGVRLGVLLAVGYGAVRSAALAWGLGDVGVGLMAWLNIIAILILQKPALVALRDFEAQKRAGKAPTFTPAALGIPHAELWTERGRPAVPEQSEGSHRF